MNKRTVIKGLQNQSKLLETDKLDFNSMWLENTGTWLELAFNEQDDIFKKFVDVRTMFIYRYKDEPDKEGLIEITREAYKPLVKSAIEKIKIVGIQSSKKNFIAELSNAAIIGYVVAIFLAGAGLTEWIHKLIQNEKSSITPITTPNPAPTNLDTNKKTEAKADTTRYY